MCNRPVLLTLRRSTNRWGIAVVTAAAILLCPGAVFAQNSTPLVGAGGGVFGGAASFSGVALTAMRYGMGVDIADNGSADGTVETTLLGISVFGQPQVITVEAMITGGSISASGVANVSGMSTVDMGDGTPPVTGMSFTLTVTPNASGQGSLVLVVDTTMLPAAVVTQGGMSLPVCTPPELGQTLVFLDSQTLSWSASGVASSYNLYRGSIDGGAWTFDHVCLAPALLSPGATDAGMPPTGRAFYYLVSARNACGDSSLGVTSSGQQRPNLSPCL
jgi:hypothetical protein